MTDSAPGFTLVETLIATTTLLIFLSVIAVITSIISRNIGESKLTGIAMRLAHEQIELAHNLPYVDVGTVGGIPAGYLDQQKITTIDSQQFVVTTSVVYIDDPFDDVAPTDPIPSDYKRIRVSVDWDGVFSPTKPLVLVTDIAPKGLEFDAGGGTLSILVFDSVGDPVPNAEVTIKAEDTDPQVDLTSYTDVTGRILLPGAPTCIECYKITATKSGFSTDRTYGSDEVANPSKPHVSILEGQLSSVSFAIDQSSSITFKAVRDAAHSYAPFQGVQMLVVGGKQIGTNELDEPVYKYDDTVVTGFGGVVTVNNLEWDNYTISLPLGSSVDMAGSWPFSPAALSPGQNLTFTMVVTPSTTNTILVKVLDQTYQPLASASVTLKHDATSFIATSSTGLAGTGDWSQAFFGGLLPQVYSLIINSPNYQTATASVSINQNTIEQFLLNPE